jgi:dinuclear metal center YbgI/SA1388 family protein
VKIKEVVKVLEEKAPLSLQESYDNSGLLTGSYNDDVSSILITLDVTNEVIDEAIENGFNMIISHHPVIFKGLKKITGGNLTEDLIIKAIKNDIALYGIHTNIDSIITGVNAKLGEKLKLSNLKILKPGGVKLKKVVVFCPVDYAEKVRQEMFNAGAGDIGNYDSCSFNTTGEGTFRANEGANPFVGDIGEIRFEKEIRVETVVPDFKLNEVINAMISVHPYEEVAYDIYSVDNEFNKVGAGMVGEINEEINVVDYLKYVKEVLNANVLRFNKPVERPLKKIAFCGGSGSFLINDAVKAGADIYITADIKYHDFFEHLGKMTLVDAGHYETEQFTKELLYEIITEKFPTFAVRISEINTNPVTVL